MTSNVGSQFLSELGEREYDEIRKRVMESVRSTFKPEFINRIDDIIIFHPLSKEHIKVIVDIQLEKLKALLKEKKIDLDLTERAKVYLAEQGYDEAYGARPLKRVLQHELQNRLAIKLLDGEINEGATVVVDVEDGVVMFQ
jgi:ATP-dependent Clp protease ATP-binding subunit ClpB